MCVHMGLFHRHIARFFFLSRLTKQATHLPIITLNMCQCCLCHLKLPPTFQLGAQTSNIDIKLCQLLEINSSRTKNVSTYSSSLNWECHFVRLSDLGWARKREKKASVESNKAILSVAAWVRRFYTLVFDKTSHWKFDMFWGNFVEKKPTREICPFRELTDTKMVKDFMCHT